MFSKFEKIGKAIEKKMEIDTFDIMVFTHTDLDGIGCPLVIRSQFEDMLSHDKLDIEYCTYGSYADINEKMKDFITAEKYNEYDLIFITDVSVSLEVAELIEKNFKDKVVLLDHHKTVMELNKYDWALIETNHRPDMKACGTSLVYEWFRALDLDLNYNGKFVEAVRRYDTWEWKTKYNDETAKELNDIYHIYGKERFFNVYTELIENYTNIFDDEAKLLLELEEEKKKKYIWKKGQELRLTSVDNYSIGVVFAENYISELGNKLAEDNEDLDFIAIITGTGIAFRGIKDNIDLGEFAKNRYENGGGHPKAAGAGISNDVIEKMINTII